jgi:hypothetical protein
MFTPPGDGPAYWVGNTEFVTVKATGRDTGGAFALVELAAMPGPSPPRPPVCEASQRRL